MSRRHPAPPQPDVDETEAYRVFHNTCGKKVRVSGIQHARALARSLESSTGQRTSPYRCPFSSVVGEEHYHNGHVPGPDGLARLAAVIRWFGTNGFDSERAP